MATKKNTTKDTRGQMPKAERSRRAAADSKWFAEYAKKCAKENEKKSKK